MAHAAHREAHPLPYVLVHWAHLASTAVLGVTGWQIHAATLPLRMAPVRTAHFVAMYVCLITLVVRAWFLFAGRTALAKDTREVGLDVRNFLPQEANRGQLVETVRYYLFLRPTHPPSAKYNPLQKAAYVLIGVLLLAQALTGFALYTPAQSAPGLGGLLGAFTSALGGLMAVRMWHYFLLWAFLAIVLVHVYLSVAEDRVQLPLMFAWRETEATEEEPAEEPGLAETA